MGSIASIRQFAERKEAAIKTGVMLALLATFFLRNPSFFLEPRFQGEEGTFCFARAYQQGWATLLKPHQEYWPYLTFLWDFAAVVAAKTVPLDLAPLVTISFAFAVLAIPFAIALWGSLSYWPSLWQRVFLVLVFLFAPGNGTIWGVLVASHFAFLLVNFLILCSRTESYGRCERWICRMLLLVGGLTGGIPCFLLPLFVLRAMRKKLSELWIQAAILASCTVVQLACMITPLLRGTNLGNRFATDLGAMFWMMWTKGFAYPLLGSSITAYLNNRLVWAWEGNHTRYVVLLWIMAGALLAFMTALCSRLDGQRRWLFLGSLGILYVLMPFLSGDGPHRYLYNIEGGTRYAYVPSIILLLASGSTLRMRYAKMRDRVLSAGFLVLLVLGLSSGALKFRSSTAYFSSMPRWDEELAKWRQDPSYAMKMGGTYTMRLVPRESAE